MKKYDFAVIFDMDGVIINNIPYHKRAWNNFCKRHDLHFSEHDFMHHMNGKTNPEILEYLFGGNLTKEQIKEYIEEKESLYRNEFEKFAVPLKGLISFLEELRASGIKIAIATSAPPKNVEFILEKTGVKKYFKTIIDETQTSKGKPNPEIFLNTARKLKTNSSKCVVFEDSLLGVQAAKNAGMKVIAITTTLPKKKLSDANLVIKDFTQININKLVFVLNKK